MKHGKLFAKIVYYLFAFTIGILLALFLPFILMSDGENLKIMASSLKKGNYSDAMLLVGGYFDDQAVYQENFEGGGGMVLFSAATLVYSDSEDVGDETQIHTSYAGFLYGVSDYAVTSDASNQTQLSVQDASGEIRVVTLLDSDLNGDGKKDTIGTLYTNGFFFLELDAETFPSLRKLTFYDKDGNVYREVSLELNYDEQFFLDVSEFVAEYNRDYKSDKLSELDAAFKSKSEHYKISSLGVAQSRADTKATIIVVVYFAIVYIFADFVLGRHYILRFFKWILFKVFKIKPKEKKPSKQSEAFGNDYYCQVTFELDVSEAENFSESVQIRYTDEKGAEISFILLKQENYSTTQRIKAGIYMNLWIDLDKTEYGTRDLPETLYVEGYHKTFLVKILKREEKRDENFHSTPDESLPE